MPKFLKRTLKYAGYFILCFISFVLLYLLTAFCLSRITVAKENSTPDMAIYIKTNGVHTDVVVPAKNEVIDWTSEIKFQYTHLKDTTNIHWLALGWGDKGFYLGTPQWSDLTFSTAFKAAFALGNTAMHTTYYSEMNENASCKKIMISTEQYKWLVKYIDNSFEHANDGLMIPIITNANYGDNDAFYEATGSYSLFKTCNSWANTALKKCGQRACLWTAFDTGIFLKYK